MTRAADREAPGHEIRTPPSRGAALALPAVCLTGLAAVYFGGLDASLFRLLNDAAPAHAAVWQHVSLLGEGFVLLALCAPAVRRHPRWLFAVLLAACLTALFTHLLKDLVAATRPVRHLDDVQLLVRKLSRGSFPSGHTTSAFALAGLVCLGGAPRWLAWIALPVATAIGLARVAVGVHWPRDVLAGAALGWLCAALALALAARWSRQPAGGLKLLVLATPAIAGLGLLFDPPAPGDGAGIAHTLLAGYGLLVGGALWLLAWRDRRTLRA